MYVCIKYRNKWFWSFSVKDRPVHRLSGCLVANTRHYKCFQFFSVLNTDGRVVDQARAWCQSMGAAFFRMSPLLSADVELDEKDDKVLVDMMWTAMAYIHSKKDDVMQLKAFLLCD